MEIRTASTRGLGILLENDNATGRHLYGADIDFISHIEHAYGLSLNQFSKNTCGAMSKNTSKASSNCDILSAFPMMHISKRIESWVEKLMDFHKDELKEAELRCTRAETVNFIVAVFMGSFIQGAESLELFLRH